MVKRLFEPPGGSTIGAGDGNEETSRYLVEQACRTIYERILKATAGGGFTSIVIQSTWTGNLRWANNRIISSGNTQDLEIFVRRDIAGANGRAQTNRIDDEGIRDVVARAEWASRSSSERGEPMPMQHTYPPFAKPELFFQRTIDVSATERSRTARQLVEPAIAENLRAAGYLELQAVTRGVYDTHDLARYYRATQAQYSVTVRTPDGTGSGWAGINQSDWAKIDASAISMRAQQKCIAAKDPRRIEPGRYTVILEPQAVHDLVITMFQQPHFNRRAAEAFPTSTYGSRPGFSKLGVKIIDERISVTSDPMDPEDGYIPFDFSGESYQPVSWIKDGVLMNLPYERSYAVRELTTTVSKPNSGSIRMSGGDTTINTMIETTRRGLLVTRLSRIETLDGSSLLCTGVTRDGLWLIENGKISMPVRNFRFTDSSLFALNNIEAIGTPVRIFQPGAVGIVPPLKVRDFNMSSTVDAI